MVKVSQALGGQGRAAPFWKKVQMGFSRRPIAWLREGAHPSVCRRGCVRGEVGEPAAENNRGNFLSNIMERSAGVVASGVVPSGLRA